MSFVIVVMRPVLSEVAALHIGNVALEVCDSHHSSAAVLSALLWDGNGVVDCSESYVDQSPPPESKPDCGRRTEEAAPRASVQQSPQYAACTP